MVVLSKARRMAATLRLLRHERGLVLPDAPVLLLLDPAEGPLIMSGVASSAMTLDFDRVRTAPRAFGPLLASVPLRLDHDDSTEPGTIEELSYAPDGSLMVVPRVACPKALRRPAWSISAAVDEYTIDERDITATIHRCRLMEVSLVANPCDPHSRVLSRERPSPFGEFYTLMAQRIDCLQRMTALLKESVHAHA